MEFNSRLGDARESISQLRAMEFIQTEEQKEKNNEKK